MENQTNDLEDFMYNVTKEIASEYERIQKRSKEDPGTAGDQGEENWAEILRKWLPRDYQIVLKGRLMNEKGETSPQVDIIVLKPFYPEYLLNKKLYLTAGVAAAFECKNTLKKEHIKKVIENSVKIRNLFPSNLEYPKGNYKEEMNSPIIYGLLSHSHNWKGQNSKPIEVIEKYLSKEDREQVKHPRECLDILCVSDLATWYSHKLPMKMMGLESNKIMFDRPLTASLDWVKIIQTRYMITNTNTITFVQQRDSKLLPIVGMLSELYKKLSLYDKRLKEFSGYLTSSIGASAQMKIIREYNHNIFSKEARNDLEINKSFYQKFWYEE